MKEYDTLSKNALFIFRKNKLLIEIQSAKRILMQDIEPLEIGDKFIHDLFKLMEDNICKENPELNKHEIQKLIKKNLKISEKVRSHKKKDNEIG